MNNCHYCQLGGFSGVIIGLKVIETDSFSAPKRLVFVCSKHLYDGKELK